MKLRQANQPSARLALIRTGLRVITPRFSDKIKLRFPRHLQIDCGGTGNSDVATDRLHPQPLDQKASVIVFAFSHFTTDSDKTPAVSKSGRDGRKYHLEMGEFRGLDALDACVTKDGNGSSITTGFLISVQTHADKWKLAVDRFSRLNRNC